MHSHRAPIALAWLALLGACAPPDGPYATSPSSLSAALADSAALRVLTINARARFDRWRDRFPLVADEIVRLSPHLVALQEVTVGAGQHDALQKYIAARSPGGVSPYAVYGEQGDMGGNVILSRLPLLARARHDLSNGRIAIMVHVALDNGATLRVFNTHLHHVRDDEAVRTQQISDVLGWIDARVGDDAALLLGDLNSEPDTTTLARLRAAGFTDTYLAVHGASATQSWGATFPIKLADGAFEQSPTRRIDYVLARDARASKRLLLDDARLALRNHDSKGLYPSDHLAVMATLRMLALPAAEPDAAASADLGAFATPDSGGSAGQATPPAPASRRAPRSLGAGCGVAPRALPSLRVLPTLLLVLALLFARRRQR